MAGQKELILNESEESIALKLARDTIGEYLESGKEIAAPHHDFLQRPAGAFVTLKSRDGQLRGCIGYIEAIFPLGQTIVKCAISAAVHDPRFVPVRLPELPRLHIEISVLSETWQIKNPEEIEVGKHGIIISMGPFRGLLLPQVATEYNWDRVTFLQHTCGKAGLPPDAWRNPQAKIEIFSAHVFGEPE